MTLLDIDPNLVKPGYTALIVMVALLLTLVPLFLSMRRQFRKINIPGDPRGTDDEVTPPSGR